MSERLAWGKFSWSDWENDPALALVSMGAQGLWMRLLCIAAKEGGYVRIGGEAPTHAKIARIVRASQEEVDGWIAELEEERVFSRTGDGVIYSRRMVREARASSRNRANGALGGNPNLRKDNGNPQPVNPPSQPPEQPPPKTPVKAEEKREEVEEPNGSVASPSGDAFAQAWIEFPAKGRRRSSQVKAKPAWRKAAKAAGGDGRLLAAVRAYAGSEDAKRDDGAFVPAFDRWLRDGRWEHDLGATTSLFDAAPQDVVDPWEARVRECAANQYWNRTDWGPKPGQPGCRAPAEIQTRHGFAPINTAAA